MRKNISACLFNVHNTISSSRHGQVCLMRLRFDRYFSHHRFYDRRGITRNIASLKTIVHDVINLLHYRYFMTQDREVVSPVDIIHKLRSSLPEVLYNNNIRGRIS